MNKKLLSFIFLPLFLVYFNGIIYAEDFIFLNKTQKIIEDLIDYSIAENQSEYYVNCIIAETNPREIISTIRKNSEIDIAFDEILNVRELKDFHIITYDTNWNKISEKIFIAEGVRFTGNKKNYIVIGDDNTPNYVDIYNFNHNLLNSYNLVPDYITSNLNLIYINRTIGQDSGFILIYDNNFNLITIVDTYIPAGEIDVIPEILEKNNKLYIVTNGSNIHQCLYILDDKFRVIFKKQDFSYSEELKFNLINEDFFVLSELRFDTQINRYYTQISFYDNTYVEKFQHKYSAGIENIIIEVSENSNFFAIYDRENNIFTIFETLLGEKGEINVSDLTNTIGGIEKFKVLNNGKILSKFYETYNITFESIDTVPTALIDINEVKVINTQPSFPFEKIFTNVEKAICLTFNDENNSIGIEFVYYKIKNSLILENLK